MTLHDTKKYVKITLEKIMDCKEITKCTSTIDLSCDNSSQLTKYFKRNFVLHAGSYAENFAKGQEILWFITMQNFGALGGI